jgi:hypothetical protein
MKILNSLKQFFKELSGISQITALHNQIDDVKILTAKLLIHQIKTQGIYENIQDAEFKVFSQFGDDGIIQYLINHIEIPHQTFIEFGVENYTESNTRFLLINNNWKGLVIDGNRANIDYIRRDSLYWKYDLTAVPAFVDKDNINKLLLENNFSGEIGILSIDIDGNDYWVWESIHVVDPIIVIIEYNSVFGDRYAITVPYDPNFNRTKAHFSNLFWGCSLKALGLLAEKKGYVFVGSNSQGNNAYFVRKDKLGRLKPLRIEEGYVKSKFRDSRDREGHLSHLSGEERLKVIGDMLVYDLEKSKLIKLRDLEV